MEQAAVADANELNDGRLAAGMPTPEPGSNVPDSKVSDPPTPTAPPTGKGKWDAKWDTYRDNFGRSFNPVLHEHDSKGDKLIPRISKTGKLMFKRGNNKTAKQTSFVGADPAPGQSGAAPGAQPGGPQPMDQAAAMHAQAKVTVLACLRATQMIMGDEWKPDAGEEEMLTECTKAYMIEKGMQGFSPGLALLVVASSFAGKRFTMPETRKRMAKFREGLAYLWGRWRGRMATPTSAAPRGESASPPDSQQPPVGSF
jgi:hypothetical protein